MDSKHVQEEGPEEVRVLMEKTGDMNSFNVSGSHPAKPTPTNVSDDHKLDTLKASEILMMSPKDSLDPEKDLDFGEVIPLPEEVTRAVSGRRQDPKISTLDKKRNYEVFSTIPRKTPVSQGSDSDSEDGGARVRPAHRKPRDSLRGGAGRRPGADNTFTNPVFMEDDGGRNAFSMPRLGSKKKVSWNDAIVYSSDTRTDVKITGHHGQESETEEQGPALSPNVPPPRPQGSPGILRARKEIEAMEPSINNGSAFKAVPVNALQIKLDKLGDANSFDSIEDIKHKDDTYDTNGAEFEYEKEKTEAETRQMRMLVTDADLALTRPPPPPSELSFKSNKSGESKYSLCVAVVLVGMAVVGLIVLGTLYGIRYSSSTADAATVSELSSTLGLVKANQSAVFIEGYTRSAVPSQQDGATYYLIQRGNLMPWQAPGRTANLVWIRGGALRTYSLSAAGRLRSRVLGDPLNGDTAQYTVTMVAGEWHAARLAASTGYALLALTASDAVRWQDANTTHLMELFPYLESQIQQYERPNT